MSTEKRWNYGVRDDETIWVSEGQPTQGYYAFDMTCDKTVAKQIVNSLNATAGIPDPESAIKAAREALEASNAALDALILVLATNVASLTEDCKPQLREAFDAKAKNILAQTLLLNAKGER